MFIILLIRRFGLAIGSYFLAYYLVAALSQLTPTTSITSTTQLGVAAGAAIVAFFLPKPGFKSPASTDK